MKKDFSYGLVPIYKDEEKIEFLLTQHIEGHWAFPKGHAKGDETSLEAAQREFEEEAGIAQYRVDEGTTFEEEYYPQKDGQILHKTVVYYPAFVSDKKVVASKEEVADFGWFEYQEAMNKITFSGSKKILRQVRKYLQKNR
ncbi:NUDIX domain-containing protein [Patescibacteria group bacterium]|nr:NUDIX domain-containing protein [Patescibacteria group bacterium]MBU1966880.1 NUDIX domain-containing protein [Patescibacteria group bacterium]MBU2543218.1 NUDIX domain-containing protein [Patescibacteria group bacterium]